MMNCTELSDLFGLECSTLDTVRGSKALLVGTPFLFADGEPVPLYLEASGDRIRFFDNGDVLFHMAAMGLDVSDRRRWGPFRTIAARYGVALKDDGEFETWERSTNAPAGFARFLSALLATAEWERDNIGLPADAHLLIDEAELYLRAWKPKAVFDKDVSVSSFTGRAYDFNFRIDNELVDVIGASPTATGSELRKLIDVRRVSENADVAIRVVIDDRRDAKRADNEAKIISGLATVWPMSKLIASVGSANA